MNVLSERILHLADVHSNNNQTKLPINKETCDADKTILLDLEWAFTYERTVN